MPLTIIPVTTKKEMKQFICFNYALYKDSPYAVPELYTDVRDTLDPNKNAAFEFCEAQPFIALRDGKVVGRIVAIINHKANSVWNKKAVRFGSHVRKTRPSLKMKTANNHFVLGQYLCIT